MPELVFKGKEYVYNHHLTVPYRPLVPELLSREMPTQILFCKPRPDHSQRQNTGQERGEAQRYVVEADIDEGMHIAGYDEKPCQ